MPHHLKATFIRKLSHVSQALINLTLYHHCCCMGTAVKHPVSEGVKQPFVFF